MTRRSGVTLLEVLVAIFVMGIGMLALLTLFPLGALRMGMAIQSERCAQAGANAQAMSVFTNIRNEPGLFDPILNNVPTNPPDPFQNPGVGIAANALPDGPSYPVFIDPIGWRSTGGGNSLNTLAASFGGSFVSRRTVSFVKYNPQAGYQWFTLLDDIDFENAVPGSGLGFGSPGAPRLLTPPPSSFSRDIRYSYAFLCQRPRYADATVVDTAIVVYNKRPIAGPSLNEIPYISTMFNNVANTITINYNLGGVPPPPVRAGDWVLDATPMNPNAGGQPTTAHGYFYRIVAVNDLGGNVTELEVETPLRGFPTNPTPYPGVAIILDGVAEVFTTGTARLP